MKQLAGPLLTEEELRIHTQKYDVAHKIQQNNKIRDTYVEIINRIRTAQEKYGFSARFIINYDDKTPTETVTSVLDTLMASGYVFDKQTPYSPRYAVYNTRLTDPSEFVDVDVWKAE
jgi:hypothetical protein